LHLRIAMRDDAVPEPILGKEYSRAQTVELCGNRRHRFRCGLAKDHDGMHESLGLRGPVRWVDDEGQ